MSTRYLVFTQTLTTCTYLGFFFLFCKLWQNSLQVKMKTHKVWGCLKDLWTPELMVSPYACSKKKREKKEKKLYLQAERSIKMPTGPLSVPASFIGLKEPRKSLDPSHIPAEAHKRIEKTFIPNRTTKSHLICFHWPRRLVSYDSPGIHWLYLLFWSLTVFEYVLSWPTSVLLERLLPNYGGVGA